ncbi:MAG: iron-containing alcohol dehydrogenase family protein [Verrucomicrobiales bacterium]
MQPESKGITAEELCEGIDVPREVVNFAHTPGTRVVFGPGTVEQAGDLVKGLGGSHVLLVTDSGILKAGHAEWLRGILRRSGLEVTIFSDVHENPTTDDVNACVAVAQAAGIDLIVGLGGGSSLDTAKGCNFLLTNGGEMKDYWGIGKAGKPMLPFVAIPTTAGTGSECQSFALIADKQTHLKMACGDKKASASIAILDPELTLTQPAIVTAHTGVDAITHAVETAVTKKRSDISAQYSRLAFALLDRGFQRVLREPKSLVARSQMQLGAAYAGTAIENSMLGAAHSAANPLTAHFNIVHGDAVGVMIPHVVRMNASLDPVAAARYSELFDGDLAMRLEEHLDLAGVKRSLRDYGLDEADLPKLSAEAAEQWTAQFNPVEVDAPGFEALYRGAM